VVWPTLGSRTAKKQKQVCCTDKSRSRNRHAIAAVAAAWYYVRVHAPVDVYFRPPPPPLLLLLLLVVVLVVLQ